MGMAKNPIKTYLILVLGVCFGLGALERIVGNGTFYQLLGIGFTFIPVVAALITRRLTGVGAKYHLSLKVWEHPKEWLFSAFAPGILVAAGAFLYFFVFPNEYSGVFKYGMRLGTDAETVVTHPLLIALIAVVIAAAMIPIQLLELGEEIGWRGYLLGFQVEKYGERKAVLINGLEWGVSHLPLIYFGFNYSLKNPGAPWTNMLMMVIACVVLGVLFSYITIRTGNCMYAAIMHGVVNVIGELPVCLTYDMESGLLGPNPSGAIGLAFFIALSVVLMTRMKGQPDTQLSSK